ncbi:MAG TPA: hypothetical protein VF997_05945 [Polyangia bacterium]
MRTAVLFLLVSGCGFHSVGNGDGGSNDMATSAMDDLAGVDLWGVPPGSDLSMISGGGCAAPLLLVGVENLHNGDTGGGRVARFSLTSSGQKQCTTLSGQGLIGPQPLAVAGFSGGIGAAAIDGLYVVDPANDTVKWSKPAPQVSGWLPLDAFSILTPQGMPIIAVAYGMSGNPSTIRELDAFDESGAAQPGAKPWCIQGANCTSLPLSLGILSASATPTDLTHFIVLDYATPAAAWDVNPWTQTKTQYIGTYSENLGSIYAVVASGKARYAWLDQTMPAGSIQYATDSGSGPSTIGGPFKCASGCATLLHVVPDPTTLDGYFALCDGATVDARTVVRIDATLACTPILDGKTFGAESRLSRLGILQ